MTLCTKCTSLHLNYRYTTGCHHQSQHLISMHRHLPISREDTITHHSFQFAGICDISFHWSNLACILGLITRSMLSTLYSLVLLWQQRVRFGGDYLCQIHWMFAYKLDAASVHRCMNKKTRLMPQSSFCKNSIAYIMNCESTF